LSARLPLHECDPIAASKATNEVACRLNGAGDFMTHHSRQASAAKVACAVQQIVSTNTASGDPYEHLIRSDRWFRDIREFQHLRRAETP
jgi:hypothetical protein